MSRIRKKIEKRAAGLLIESGFFNKSDWDEINLCFYSVDYFGECCEINPWDCLYSMAVDFSTEYPEDCDDDGRYIPIKKNEYPSIIEVIRLYKALVVEWSKNLIKG